MTDCCLPSFRWGGERGDGEEERERGVEEEGEREGGGEVEETTVCNSETHSSLPSVATKDIIDHVNTSVLISLKFQNIL